MPMCGRSVATTDRKAFPTQDSDDRNMMPNTPLNSAICDRTRTPLLMTFHSRNMRIFMTYEAGTK